MDEEKREKRKKLLDQLQQEQSAELFDFAEKNPVIDGWRIRANITSNKKHGELYKYAALFAYRRIDLPSGKKKYCNIYVGKKPNLHSVKDKIQKYLERHPDLKKNL